MTPLHRTTGLCRMDGVTCNWCGQMILPGERMTALTNQTGREYWHHECEQASIAEARREWKRGQMPRPKLPLPKMDINPEHGDDNGGIVIGLAFGVAFALFLAVLGHGMWKFFTS